MVGDRKTYNVMPDKGKKYQMLQIWFDDVSIATLIEDSNEVWWLVFCCIEEKKYSQSLNFKTQVDLWKIGRRNTMEECLGINLCFFFK